MERIGERIRKTRKEKGLTVLQLSQKAYCGERALINIESGETHPHPDDIRWVSKALRVSEEELTKGTDWEVKA